MSAPPLTYDWIGDSFKPATPSQAWIANKHFVIGERYELVEWHNRSENSHRHYFAAVHEAFLNLPEALALEYPNEEKLRKHALIKAGFADSQTLVCSSKAEAVRMATFIRPIDEFSIVITQGCTVTRYTAKSQSTKAMGKEDFARSKEAVLSILAGMIGTTKQALAESEAT